MNTIKTDNLKYIGSGSYGKVYKDGNQAIKIYYKEWETDNHRCTFHVSKFKLNRLKSRINKLDGCYHINDFIYINNKIAATNYDFIEGETLDKVITKYNKKERIEISRNIVNASKILTDKKIYPRDYKLNNIICCPNGDIVIIDLDDPFTKLTTFKNSIYLNECSNALSKTITSFVETSEIPYPNLDLDRYKEVIKLRESLFKNYKKINTFLNNVDININNHFIVLNHDDINLTNMLYIKSLANLTNAKIIIQTEKKLSDQEQESLYYLFNNLSLILYDVYNINDKYNKNNNTNNINEYLEMESLKKYLFFKQNQNMESNLNHDIKVLTKKR